jgi:hypothetical protein
MNKSLPCSCEAETAYGYNPKNSEMMLSHYGLEHFLYSIGYSAPLCHLWL